jgi:hypothetical protein
MYRVFLYSFLNQKIQTQFEVFLVYFEKYTCYELEFCICYSIWHV